MAGPESGAALLQLLNAPFVFQMVAHVAKLGIPDLLAGGHRSAEELAAATGTLAAPLRRVLRALAANGVVAERPDGTFEATAATEMLRDSPASLRNVVLMFAGPQFDAWRHLDHSLRTGGIAFEHVHGKRIFEHFADHPEEGRIFNAAMSEFSRIIGPVVAGAYEFGRFGTLMDVGGGHGEQMIAILERFDSLKGVVFDLPEVADGTRRALADAGLADRCTVTSGSFFESLPSGADAIIMKAIIHDWEDALATTLLQRCRDALPADGTLLIVDRVLPDHVTPDADVAGGTFMDVNMLVNTGGLERTEGEWDTLLSGAGFKIAGITSLVRGISLIEAMPS